MPKRAKELSPLEVGRLNSEGVHSVGGVVGLYLQVTSDMAKSWLYRFSVGGKRRKMGLGSFPTVTLATARTRAREAESQINSGIDPIDSRKEAHKLLAASRVRDKTFKECAQAYITAQKDGWKNWKHEGQWSATLETYAYPFIGDLWVRDVELKHIMQILEPIWLSKTETAQRVRGRIESVLDSARTKGYRDGLNPAAWKGNLATLLPKPSKVKKVKHHKALAPTDVGEFMRDLRATRGVGARALEFLILTNVRSYNVRFATWKEIDFETKTWDIPGEDSDGTGQRMKMGVTHRVPLSKQALDFLKKLKRVDGTELLFPSPSKKTQLSDMAMNKVMRDMGANGVPHGFRSTFRDWAQDYTNFQAVIAEKAMAHTVGDKSVQAYLRSDAFKKRVRLMQTWSDFCDIVRAHSPDNVVSMKAKSA
jgi:integrase